MPRQIIKLIVISLLACSPDAQATNGYFSHGLGTRSKGMAGAGVALAQDALGGALNPANMSLLGSRMDIGGALFVPERGFTAYDDATGPLQATPGEYDSENDYFLIPQFAYSHHIDDTATIGIAVAANGLDTEYSYPIFQYFGPGASEPAGVDLYQIFIHVPYSIRLDSRFSLGLAPVFAVQAFRARGLEPFRFVSIHPDGVTNNGFDYSYGMGLNAGFNYRPIEPLSIGLAAQSRINMTKFDEYRGLIAEEGNFDIPQSFQFGVALHALPTLTLVLDYQKIYYSRIPALGNPNNVPLTPNSMGADDGIGGGWRDAGVVKFGVIWEYGTDIVLRAGYSHSNQIIPNTQALINILAPAVGNEHYSLGMTRQLDAQSEISLALTFSPEHRVTGTNPNTDGQTGVLQMQQTELEITYGWKF